MSPEDPKKEPFLPDIPGKYSDISVGTILDGRYEILEQFGAGGVGLVYKAQHIQLGLTVAVKVLQDQFLTNNMMRPRFEREARALGTLAHPNIVSVTDFGITDGRPYLVMELLKGETLRSFLEKGPLPIDMVVRITNQILQGLAYAHLQGFVHRDLKPSNIYIQQLPSTNFQVKILDFGLVKFVDQEDEDASQNLTKSGIAVGTPSYMAPEQVIGDKIGPSTDVYAMGILLFEMLVGHAPFRGELAEIVRQHLTKQVPKLQKENVNLEPTAELQELVKRAVDKDPKNRFEDAASMLQSFVALPNPPAVRNDLSHATTLIASVDEITSPATMREAKKLAKGGSFRLLKGTLRFTGKVIQKIGKALFVLSVFLLRTLLAIAKWTAKALFATVKAIARLAVALGIPKFALLTTILILVLGGAYYFYKPAEEPGLLSKKKLSNISDKLQETFTAPLNKIKKQQKQIDALVDSKEKAQKTQEDTTDSQEEIAAPRSESQAEEQKEPSVTTPTPAKPSRPSAHNPWVGRKLPRLLAAYRKRILKGHKLGTSALKSLREYAKKHRGDPRPSLLLARAYMLHDWYRDALERYELAFRIDPRSRGDKHMLRDLIYIVQYPKLSYRAKRAVEEIYGPEALDRISRDMKRSDISENEKAALEQLRRRILANR